MCHFMAALVKSEPDQTMIVKSLRRTALQRLWALPIALILPSCSMISGSGPSARAVNNVSGGIVAEAGIRVVDVNDTIARRLFISAHPPLFSDILGDGQLAGTIVRRGDVLDIAIWEAPPATLFGSAGTDTRMAAASTSISRGTSLPEQMVDSDGRIVVPFAGPIMAADRTPSEISRDIAQRLLGKAHKPQVIVRLVQNSASNVTVVGDVTNSVRMPISSRGERLLDAVAAAGGVKQPIGKMTVQVTRGQKTASFPLETVIRDPLQNIRLQASDIVTVLFQPFSFTALGATGANAEIPFEGTGINLVQALGRVGGLQDARADVKGVFVFRFEDPEALGVSRQGMRLTPEGKLPVIYRIDMKNPATLFASQTFPIRNGDVLYVSNAPLADLQKFLTIISSTVVPLYTIDALTNNN